jgi:DNA-binding MarR family transcriptional regulator
MTPRSGAETRDLTGQLDECIKALVRRFSLAERADVEVCGVTVAQAATLDVLRREGPLRSRDLGRFLGIRPSTLTRNITRLEERGLVARSPDPRDGRVARIALSPAGRRAARAVADQNAAFAASVLGRLGQARTRDIVDALHDLMGAVRHATHRCCPGAFDHLMAGEPWTGDGGPDREDPERGRGRAPRPKRRRSPR